jgi:phage tail-like protein
LQAREPEPLLGTSNFRVLIGDLEVGFRDVSRVSSETVAAHERQHAFAPVVLRRALTTSRDLFEWRRRVAHGADDRRDVSIQQLDSPGGRVVNSWRLVRARPTRWSGPAFDASASAIAYEELELVFDDLIWEGA